MAQNRLYHIVPSFYSQIARLALAEKGVPFQEVITIAGPPVFDNYQPDYVRLNPNAVIPTFAHGDQIVYEAVEIARYADAHFEGPSLSPADPAARAKMNKWIDRLNELPIRVLSYGSFTGRTAKLTEAVNRARISTLQKLRAQNPDLAGIYDAKIKDMEGFMHDVITPEAVAEIRAQAYRYLDELDQILAHQDWIVGQSYSLADVVWTVMVARMIMLGIDPLKNRPHLQAFYERAKARPSFEQASVWEKFNPFTMFEMAAKRLGPALFALGYFALVLWVFIDWIVNTNGQ